MNSIISGFCLVLTLCCSATGGDAQPQVQKTDVYIDTVNGKLFWPMNLPFWVKLSSSPDPNAKTYLLDSYTEESDGTEKTKEKIIDKGIALEISGRQYMRWFNVLTNKSILLKFYADGDAAQLSDSLYGAPFFQTPSETFFGKGLSYSLAASDALSGVKCIFMSIDGNTFAPFSEPYQCESEKKYLIRSYVSDNVGYISKLQTAAFTVDLTPPSTTFEVQTNFSDNVFSSSTTVRLSASDKISGVKTIRYRFEKSGAYIEFTGQKITASDLGDGEHVFSFYSTDNVLNSENEQRYTFYLDIIPPVPAIGISGDQSVSEKTTFISRRSLIELNATDNKIGVRTISYTINGVKKIEVYQQPFTLQLDNGPLTVSYFAADSFGNTSSRFDKSYIMDITPPKTTFSIIGPFYQQRTAIWVTDKTAIQFSSDDKSSGVNRIDYFIGSQSAAVYAEPLNITEEGKYVVRFRGVDNVNNIENDNVILVIVDTTNPVIKEIFSTAAVDSSAGNEGEKQYTYPQYTTVFLAATDHASSIKNVWYSLNGGPMSEYHNVILCDKVGIWELRIKAEDNVGHIAEKTISFLIRAIEPGK